MAAVLKHWREAATLILATSSKVVRGVTFQLTNSTIHNHATTHEDFDVLMLKRSSKSKFMPNLYVFPGGVAVDSDFSNKWLGVFRKLGHNAQQRLFDRLSEGACGAPPMITRQRDAVFSAIPPDIAFRICAIRETFEESGVLLAQPVKHAQTAVDALSSQNKASSPAHLYSEDPVIKDWRERVNSDPDEFLNMCQELDLVPEVWSLYEWSNWLTPTRAEENMRRFDTIFYVCCVDHKPEATDDAGETVNAVWAPPSAVLSAHYKQRGGVAPPQIYELSRLLNFKTAPDLLDFISQPGRERVERYFPVSGSCKDHVIAPLPGDDLYPKQSDLYSKSQFPYFEETLAELNKKYPNHNRTTAKSEDLNGLTWFVEYSIQPRAGHARPNVEILHKIWLAAKL